MAANEIIGAVAICKRNGKYLMLKHKDGFWSFPGGKVELTDFSIKDGLIREINEELGLKQESYLLTESPVINRFIYGKEKPKRVGKKGLTYYFLMDLIKNIELHPFSEIREVNWFTKDEVLKKLLNKDMQEAVLKVESSWTKS